MDHNGRTFWRRQLRWLTLAPILIVAILLLAVMWHGRAQSTSPARRLSADHESVEHAASPVLVGTQPPFRIEGNSNPSGSTGSPTCLVLVTESGLGVRDVAMYVESGNGSSIRSLGTSSMSGEIQVAMTLSAVLDLIKGENRIWLRHKRFAPQLLTKDDVERAKESADRIVRVELTRGRTVKGKVVRASNGLPVPGARVLCVKAESTASAERDVRAMLRTPDRLEAICEKDGSFKIHGLSEDCRYKLVAGGEGQLSTEFTTVHDRSNEGHIIETRQLYLFVARMVDSLGRALPNYGRVFWRPASTMRVPRGAVSLDFAGSVPSAMYVLSGVRISSSLLREAESRRAHIGWFVQADSSDDHKDRIASVRLSVTYPGYQPKVVTGSAAKVTGVHDIDVLVVKLDQSVELDKPGRGTITLTPNEGAGAKGHVWDVPGTVAMVHLQSEGSQLGAHKWTFDISVSGPLPVDIPIGPIPGGTYAIWMSSLSPLGFSRQQIGSIRIRNSDDTHEIVRAPRCGTLLIRRKGNASSLPIVLEWESGSGEKKYQLGYELKGDRQFLPGMGLRSFTILSGSDPSIFEPIHVELSSIKVTEVTIAN